MEQEEHRGSWTTSLGFILAAVGSAVGLGNVWRFPYIISNGGGSSVLFVYLLAVLIIGFPAILIEFSIGRGSRRNPINAFSELGHPNWSFIGILCVFTGFFILSYYSVIGGWTIQYTVDSLGGGYFEDPEGYFAQYQSGFTALGLHALFMSICVCIVAFGIKKGIEMSVKLMVPAIILLLLGLAGYALTLENAMGGLEYYLEPDWEHFTDNWKTIVPNAIGQAFFTLSLGMGAMITYSSYLDEDDNLLSDSAWIISLDTGIAFIVGLIIFPVLATVGSEPGDGGIGALYEGIAGALAGIPYGEILGFIFFGTVLIAAISSAISIMEVVVSFVIDHYSVKRTNATMGVGVVAFLAGLPNTYDIDILILYDGVVSQFLLPLGIGLMIVFVGWFYRDAREEISRGLQCGPDSWFPVAWIWYIRSILLLIIGMVLYTQAHNAYNQVQGALERLF